MSYVLSLLCFVVVDLSLEHLVFFHSSVGKWAASLETSVPVKSARKDESELQGKCCELRTCKQAWFHLHCSFKSWVSRCVRNGKGSAVTWLSVLGQEPHFPIFVERVEWGHISLKWTRTLSSASLLPCGQVNICEAPLPLWIQEQHHRVLMGMNHSLWGSKTAQPLSPSCGRTPQIWHNGLREGRPAALILFFQLSPGHSGGQDQWVTWRSPGNKRWGYKCMLCVCVNC